MNPIDRARQRHSRRNGRMQASPLPQRREIELGHAAMAILSVLERETDEIFQDLLASPVRRSIERQRARVANAIVVLCRDLAQEIQRYSHLCWLQDDNLADGLSEDDLEF